MPNCAIELFHVQMFESIWIEALWVFICLNRSEQWNEIIF